MFSCTFRRAEYAVLISPYDRVRSAHAMQHARRQCGRHARARSSAQSVVSFCFEVKLDQLDVGHFLSCFTPIIDLNAQSPQRNATPMGISRASRLRRGYQFVPELHTSCVAFVVPVASSTYSILVSGTK